MKSSATTNGACRIDHRHFGDRLVGAISFDPGPKLPAGSFVEAAIVLRSKLPATGFSLLEQLIARLEIEVVPFTRFEAVGAVAGTSATARGATPPP